MLGSPLNSALFPGLEGRRSQALHAGASRWRPLSLVEAGVNRLDLDAQVGADTSLRLRPGPVLGKGSSLELYAEYAQRDAHPARWVSLDRDLGRGLDLSSFLAAGSWGQSLEYKNYRDFLIADINNPPPLICEHETYLLNRQTQALLPDDETGVLLEASYTFAGGASLLYNHTRNPRASEPGRADDEHLRSSFLQCDAPLGEGLRAQATADLTRSAILRDERRFLLGTRWVWQWWAHRTLPSAPISSSRTWTGASASWNCLLGISNWGWGVRGRPGRPGWCCNAPPTRWKPAPSRRGPTTGLGSAPAGRCPKTTASTSLPASAGPGWPAPGAPATRCWVSRGSRSAWSTSYFDLTSPHETGATAETGGGSGAGMASRAWAMAWRTAPWSKRFPGLLRQSER